MTTQELERPPQVPAWLERHPAAVLSAFVLVLAGLLDVGAGVAFRLVAGYPFVNRPEVVAYERYLAREALYRVPSAVYDHDLAPLTAIDDVIWGDLRYDLRTNSLGFKDATTRRVPLRAARPRVLFVGDSFTEGVGYPYEATFVGLVDSALATRGVDVLNAAVASYSPTIYARKVEHLLDTVGLEVDEVVVFVDISDARNEARFYRLGADGRVERRPEFDAETAVGAPPSAPTSGPVAWVKEAIRTNTVVGASLFRLKHALAVRLGGLREGPPLDHAMSRWTVDSTAYAAYGREGVALMEAAMDRLHALLRDRGIGLTVAVYPWPDQIARRDLDSRHVRVWRRWSAARGVRFVDLFPAFIAGEAAADPLATIHRYYIEGDFHWNAAGHRHVARTFLAHYTPPGARAPDLQPVAP